MGGDIGVTWSRQRVDAALPALGARVPLFRTVTMLNRGAVESLMPWALGLLVAELPLDVAALLGSVRWWLSGTESRARLPLRTGAAAAVLHAVRVLIFVLGRTGSWVNFDVGPE